MQVQAAAKNGEGQLIVIMGCSCLKRQNQTDSVDRNLYERIYEEVQRTSNLRQIQSLKTNKYLYLKSAVERKGVVRKLMEHFQSHKHRISSCVSYMISFGMNPLQLIDQKCLKFTNLMVLEALIERIQVLTQDHNFVKPKKTAMQVLEMSLKRQRNSSKRLEEQRKGVLLQSDSLTKVYELSVAKLFDFFQECELSKDEQTCYLACIMRFCKYEPFKFDKQTVASLLDLTQSAFSKEAITHDEACICLQIFESLLHNIHHDTEVGVLATVLKRVLLYECMSSPDQHSLAGKCIERIVGLYESLLLQSKYLRVYEVLLEIWDDQLEFKKVLFQLAFNNILLFVLVRILTDEETRLRSAGALQDTTQNYLDINRFTRLRAVSNRNLVFSVLLQYIRWGYKTKRERLLLPLHQICICVVSNSAVQGVDVRTWLNSIVLLLKECGISISLLFKQLLSTFEELRLSGAEEMAISCLQLLAKLLDRQSDTLEQHLDEDIYRAISSRAFRTSSKLKLSQSILSVLSAVVSLPRFHSVSETYNYVIIVIAHDICRLINQQYTPAYTEVMYYCGLTICTILESIRSHKLNLFLALLERIVEVYSDSHINTWFKCGYYSMIKRCTIDTQLILCEKDLLNQELVAQCKFIFSVESPDTCPRMIEKMRKFTRQPLSMNRSAMKALPEFDENLYQRFCEVLSLTNIESQTVATIESEQANRVLMLRQRNSIKQPSNSQSNDESLQEVLNALGNF